MFRKIPKRLSAISLVVITGVFLCGFAYAKANPGTLQFTGENNTEVTVFTDTQELMQSDLEIDHDSQNYEIGQVIVSNGVKEIVFAIGTDGSYITIPATE